MSSVDAKYFNSEASFAGLAWLNDMIAMFAPCLARLIAISWPRPDAPPVTMADFPRRKEFVNFCKTD